MADSVRPSGQVKAGLAVSLDAGDVVLLPAGTGHCLQATEGRFQVVGAYPEGQQWDIQREALSEEEIAAMEALPFPRSDPVEGRESRRSVDRTMDLNQSSG
jgi:uncharacterized protein YjlB